MSAGTSGKITIDKKTCGLWAAHTQEEPGCVKRTGKLHQKLSDSLRKPVGPGEKKTAESKELLPKVSYTLNAPYL